VCRKQPSKICTHRLPDPDDPGLSRPVRLSIQAVRYGQAIARVETLTTSELAVRLYAYGYLPVPRRPGRSMPDRGTVLGWLGAGPGGAALDALHRSWRLVDQGSSSDPWLRWHARSVRDHGAGPAKTWLHKLYPAVDQLPEAVGALAWACTTLPKVRAFKIATGVAAVRRPDTIVVHFTDADSLRDGAETMRRRLVGMPARGVPFTAPVTTDGLLSWGVDPPAGPRGSAASWRQWVSLRLAEHLQPAGLADPDEPEPWRLALCRLAEGGVDPVRWEASPDVFTREPAPA
jgi:hypothetical protein